MDAVYDVMDRVGEATWRGWTGIVRTGRAKGWRFVAAGSCAGAALVLLVRLIVGSGLASGAWWLRIVVVTVAASCSPP